MLVKAQCTNCGGNLEVDNTKEAAICPFCNTPYVVEKAINQFNVSNSRIRVEKANINITNTLDADTMFENWLVSGNMQLEKDFMYYYATDPRVEYIELWNKVFDKYDYKDAKRIEELIPEIFVGDRFGRYKESEYSNLKEIVKRQKGDELIITIATLVGLIVFIIASVIFTKLLGWI